MVAWISTDEVPMKRGSSGSNGGRIKTKYSPRPINSKPLKARKVEAIERFVFMEVPILREVTAYEEK
jgi:hypothetical protein